MKRGVILALAVTVTVVLAGTGIFWIQSPGSVESNPSNIDVSASEARIFKTLTLNNGLSVVLVSDPSSDKAAAALNVFSGSWANPSDIPGLAHFLEHMLFLGTEKFPEVDGYQTFIEQNGGSDNAYTSNTNTLYHFDINGLQLEPALDRFAQFFIAPLFDAGFTERERNAVNSEFTASLQNDERRIEDVMRELTDAGHPASRLAIGNLSTLTSPEMTTRLRTFYRQHYVAANMALAIYGPQDINTLESWAIDYFAGVRAQQAPKLNYDVPLFDPVQLPLLVTIEPRREMRRLELRFPIPGTAGQLASKPNQYVGHLLGHESTGSLLSVLKAKGWAENLSASSGGITHANTTFDVQIDLTPDGLANWQAVTELLFSHIELIRQAGIQEWIFDEQKNINELAFQFAEKVGPSSTAVALAENQHYYPAAQVLSGPYRLADFTPAAIEQVLSALIPDNALVILVRPDAKTLVKSQYYQTPYRSEQLAGATVARWRTPNQAPGLALPNANPFVPTQFNVQPAQKVASALYRSTPQILLQDSGKTLWFEQDDAFYTPKVDIHLLLETNYANVSASQAMATALYLDLVNDALNEVRYEAGLAGSGYGIALVDNGIQVRLYGYQDKLHLLLDTLILELTEHRISPERFAIKKEETLRALRNRSEDPVISQMIRQLNEWLTANSFSVAEQSAAAQTLTPDSLLIARNEWLASSRLELLVHGNILADQAKVLAQRIDRIIPQGGTQAAGRAIAKLPARDFLARVNIDHADSAMLELYQGDNSSLRERALYALLAETMSAPYFADLRTREQLGYIVLARAYPIDGLPALLLYVQSPSTDAAMVQLYSNRFLSRFAQQLANMNELSFEAYKRGLMTGLTEPDKNLFALSSRYWQNIQDGNHNFNTRARIAAEVEKISLEGFRRFYDIRILGDATRSLTLHQVGVNMADDYTDHAQNIVGKYPLEQPKAWPDDIEWITPTFNNISD
ncbi:insulinase family protein [Reinekea forsetii]|uniref:Protease 3 n=1 Tax=Reinekea forsetii TaxID=1336806 RepID=A0A2K8KSH5_9GAMM|nr:insulinase family protein [Reinekea forsetii]ATX77562.1 secreted/periplasmic Zn-dependent peptidase, insulinase-like protein, M16A family [Reinekea forsetii]